MALEAPLFPEDVHQQRLGAAGRLAVDAVVRAHNGLHMGLLHRRFKGGQIGFLHVLGGGLRVELVADGLGAGVHGKVLGAGSGLDILAVALHAFDKAHAQAGGQVGILAIGFMAAAPAGIAEDVDVGAPQGQALVDVPVALGGLAVVLGAGFGGNNLRHLAVEILVKNGRHTDGLGEHRGRAGTGHAVERFVPPVVGRHAQAGNGRRVETELRGLFFQGHLRDKGLGLGPGFIAIHHNKHFLLRIGYLFVDFPSQMQIPSQSRQKIVFPCGNPAAFLL